MFCLVVVFTVVSLFFCTSMLQNNIFLPNSTESLIELTCFEEFSESFDNILPVGTDDECVLSTVTIIIKCGQYLIFDVLQSLDDNGRVLIPNACWNNLSCYQKYAFFKYIVDSCVIVTTASMYASIFVKGVLSFQFHFSKDQCFFGGNVDEQADYVKTYHQIPIRECVYYFLKVLDVICLEHHI